MTGREESLGAEKETPGTCSAPAAGFSYGEPPGPCRPLPPAPPVLAFQTLCVLCLNRDCSPWFSGWEPTAPVSMVTGKLLVPCASKGTFPLRARTRCLPRPPHSQGPPSRASDRTCREENLAFAEQGCVTSRKPTPQQTMGTCTQDST